MTFDIIVISSLYLLFLYIRNQVTEYKHDQLNQKTAQHSVVKEKKHQRSKLKTMIF